VKFVILFWDGSASWLKGKSASVNMLGRKPFMFIHTKDCKELKNDCSTPLSIVLHRKRTLNNTTCISKLVWEAFVCILSMFLCGLFLSGTWGCLVACWGVFAIEAKLYVLIFLPYFNASHIVMISGLFRDPLLPRVLMVHSLGPCRRIIEVML
jgi:hypothetical protein